MKYLFLLAFVGGVMYNVLSSTISVTAMLLAMLGALVFVLMEYKL
jgi:hypothetical protein